MANSGEPSSELMGRERNYDSAEETKIKIDSTNNQTSTSNGTEIINSTLRGKMGHIIATEDYSNDSKIGDIRPSSPSSATHLPPQHRIANMGPIIISEDDDYLDGILGKNHDELDNEHHGGGAHSTAGTASITKSPSPAPSPPAPLSAPIENNDTINSMQQHNQYQYPPIHNNMHNLQNGASHPLPLGYSNAPYIQYPSYYYGAPAQQLSPPFNQPTLHYHQGFPSLYSNAPIQQYGMRGQTRSHSDGNLDPFHHQQPLDSFHNHQHPSLFPLPEHTPSHQNGMRGQTPGYPRSHSDGNLDSIHHHQPKVYHEKDYKTGRVWREDDHRDTTPGNSKGVNMIQKINHSYSDGTQRAIPHYPTEVKQDCTVQSLTEEQVNLHEINNRRRTIRFGHIQIRTYETVIGSNPSCSRGPALGLGWRYSPHETNVSIDKYEEAIFELTGGYRLSLLELLLDKSERVSILVRLGYTSNDLAESVRSIVKTKNQRRQTADNLPVAWFEEKAEGFSRALGRMLKKRDRARHMYDKWKNSESKKNRLLIY